MSNLSISNNYKFIKKLGKGSFGEVYLVNDRSGNEYACKTEINNTKNRLKGEFFIYKRFAIRELECVPKIRGYFETPEYNLLIMQLLGKGLDVVFEESNNKIDVGTVMKIGVTIISHLEKIHRIGIIHRDIKPNNFMFGINDETDDLYVMDFGLSKRWYMNGNHIEYKTGRSMIGTARYASINIHNGSEPSRRDDMESVGYMLVYLAKGSLPWQGLKKKTKDNPIDNIGKKKMSVDLKTLCDGLPECFYEYINYTKNLQFTEKPDYDYLRNIFITSAKNNNIKIKYYWENDSSCHDSLNCDLLDNKSVEKQNHQINKVSQETKLTRKTNNNTNNKKCKVNDLEKDKLSTKNKCVVKQTIKRSSTQPTTKTIKKNVKCVSKSNANDSDST
jgi:casein kinase I homolog HRR25